MSVLYANVHQRVILTREEFSNQIDGTTHSTDNQFMPQPSLWFLNGPMKTVAMVAQIQVMQSLD